MNIEINERSELEALQNANLFESVHTPCMTIGKAKRTSINVLFTLITHDERLSEDKPTSEVLTMEIEKKSVQL